MANTIGRLALGVVGALIAPVGFAAVGFSIGSAVGGLLFTSGQNTTVEGPRLGDTDVQSSSLGKIIPEHYGTTRTGGNVFWSSGLKETRTQTTQRSGGKGGGGSSSTTTTYSYSVSFATAFGKAPASSVLRIWADGKLIYDVTGTGDVQNSQYSFRFRGGGTDQPIDPLIEESINRRLQGLPDVNEGTGPQSSYKTIDDLISEASASSDPRSAIYATYLTARRDEADLAGGEPKDYRFTPAYKELTYIVFDDMPLADFGNRIPNITAEIIWSAATPDAAIQETDVATPTENSSTSLLTGQTVNFVNNTWLIKDLTSFPDILRLFSLSSQSEINSVPSRQTIDGVLCVTNTLLGVDANGNFIASFLRNIVGQPFAVGKILPNSLEFVGATTTTQTSTSVNKRYGAGAGINGTRTLFAANTSAGDLFIYETQSENVELVWGEVDETFTGIGGGPMVSGESSVGDSVIYWAADDGNDWVLYRINVLFSATPSDPPTVNITTLTAAPIPIGTGDISSVIYSASSNSVFVLIEDGSNSSIHRFDPLADGTVDDPHLQYSNTLSLAPPRVGSGFSESSISSGYLAYAEDDDLAVIDLSTGQETVYNNVISNDTAEQLQLFIAESNSLYAWVRGLSTFTPKRISIGRLAAGTNDLAAVLEDICNRVGMTSDEYDTSDIVGDHTVRGYTLARALSGRKAMEGLLQAYYVDGLESDWVLKFQNRSTAPVRTITEDELGSVRSETGSVVWRETRQPEYDLPQEISLIYNDVDRDYQQGSAHKKRIAQPAPSMYAAKNETIELPITFNELEAKDIAEKLLYLAWMSRDTAQGKVPWTHLDLDPTDVIQLSFDGGTRILTDRISKTDVGANFEIDLNTVRSGDPVYVSAAAAEVLGTTVPTGDIATIFYSKMFAFDIPLLYDYHDTARTSNRYYTAVGSDTTSWRSAELFESTDNTAFLSFDAATVDVSWGQVTSGPLPAPRTLWTTDRENTFTVFFSVDNGDVNSVTRDEIINSNANRALIWNQTTGVAEIIQFQNVTTNPDGSKTFDTLTRGLRGTDYMVDQHEVGEVFILLNDAAIQPQVNEIGLIGTTKYYKAVSRGSLLAAAASLPVDTVARDLHPYAPSQLRREDDGTDLTVKWNRRTRIGGEWNMVGTGVEVVPLNEDNESYEVYLLPDTPTALDDFDPTDASTYSAVQSASIEEAIFLDAELTSAGYSGVDDTINVAVYQISAQVGRGFPRKAALAQ